MLKRRVIPCLDVHDGRVVKGVKFSNLRDAGDPAQRAAEYERQGADEIVLLDVSATNENRPNAADTVRRVRERLSIPLAVGGGVGAVDHAARLLDAGADKVGVNTAAIRRQALLEELASRFGRQCVVLAIDAVRMGDSWAVVIEGGRTRTSIDVVQWACRAEQAGAGEVLLTSWDRDGTRTGFDLPLIRAVCDVVSIPVIASGGASNARDCAEALLAGAEAVLAASILHDGVTTVADLKRELLSQGIEVRP